MKNIVYDDEINTWQATAIVKGKEVLFYRAWYCKWPYFLWTRANNEDMSLIAELWLELARKFKFLRFAKK